VKEAQADKVLVVNAPTLTKFGSDNGNGSLGPFLIRRLGPEQRRLSRRSRGLSPFCLHSPTAPTSAQTTVRVPAPVYNPAAARASLRKLLLTQHSSRPNATAPCRNPASVYRTTRQQHTIEDTHINMSTSAAPVAKENQLTLTTSDNATVPVDREVAERSILIKNLLEDIGESDEPIPIPNVRARHHVACHRVLANGA
jgi:hypothetical protein